MIEVAKTARSPVPDTSQTPDIRGKQLNQTDFLKMLVKQLQYQDPLKPMDNAEFTSQMAQFSSLEQLVNMNKNLEALRSSQNLVGSAQGVNFLGKQIRASGDTVSLQGGNASPLRYQLSEDAAAIVLNIYDSSGRLVRRMEPGPQGKGEHEYRWDGRSSQGTLLPDGTYRWEVQALNKIGKPVQVEQWVVGKVDAVSFQEGLPILHVAGSRIPLASVLAVTEAVPVQP